MDTSDLKASVATSTEAEIRLNTQMEAQSEKEWAELLEKRRKEREEKEAWERENMNLIDGKLYAKPLVYFMAASRKIPGHRIVSTPNGYFAFTETPYRRIKKRELKALPYFVLGDTDLVFPLSDVEYQIYGLKKIPFDVECEFREEKQG